jgi:AraC-like DNA-binding protein
LEQSVYRALPWGEPRLDDMARDLMIGPRSLERRLSAEGTTFSGVLDGLRRGLAVQYVDNSELDLLQISWLLGYESVASFGHAFRRWTGVSPTRARLHPVELEKRRP